jgi:hypothetical protein
MVAPEERDASQLRIDGQLKAVYDAWAGAGKPAVSQSPRKRFAVSPDHGPAVRHMLGRAARLHGVRVVISPVAHDKDGRELIAFTARDKEVKIRTASPELAAVREWAAEHDAALPDGDPGRFNLNTRGRIPAEVTSAFEAAKAESAMQQDEDSTALNESDTENQAGAED